MTPACRHGITIGLRCLSCEVVFAVDEAINAGGCQDPKASNEDLEHEVRLAAFDVFCSGKTCEHGVSMGPWEKCPDCTPYVPLEDHDDA